MPRTMPTAIAARSGAQLALGRREAELREKDVLYTTMLDQIPDATLLKGLDGRYLLVNRAFEEWIGKSREELIGRDIRELWPKETAELFAERDAEVLESGEPVYRDGEITYLNGKTRMVRSARFLVHTDDGSLLGIGIINTDISEQMRAEEAIRTSEARLRSIIESSPSTYSLTDLDGRCQLANKAYCEVYGIDMDKVVGSRLTDLLSPSHRAALVKQKEEVIETGQAVSRERMEVLPAGGRFHRLITKFPVRDANGEIVAIGTTATDLNELKEAEEKLRSLEARFSEILTLAPEAIISTDANGTILVFNETAETIFGYDADEVAGQPLDILLPESARTRHRGHLKEFIGSSETSRLMNKRSEISGRRKDGSIFPAEASISKLQSGGNLVLTVTMHDITERKQVEAALRTALREAQQADRAKQDFLANMSHELRTPLNAIMGFSDMMVQQMFGALGNDRYLGYSRDISASARHLLDLVNDVLDIAKIEAGKQDLNVVEIDVDAVAGEAIREIKGRMDEKNQDFSMVIDENLATIQADAMALRQILANLLSNAMKFTPENGRIDLAFSLNEYGYSRITVSDTGVGIPEADIENILVPFVQVGNVRHSGAGGTGLGLSIVNALVDLHGGSMRISSTLGTGTEVEILLPRDPNDVMTAN